MFSVLGASAVLLPAAALWLAAQALQPQPIAAPGAPLAISDLNAARRLISREVLSQAFQGEPLTLALTASQAQALAQDMGARVLHAPSSLHLSEQQADLAVSLPIRQTPLRALHPLGDWLNVRVRLSAPPSGAPVLQAVQVGELKVPPALALWAAQRIAEARGLRSMAELGLAAIETVQLSPTQVSATVRWRAEVAAPTRLHVEICEDVWVPIPPSSYAALAGATLLLNLSASNTFKCWVCSD